MREHDKRVDSLKSRPLLGSDELHWNRKNKNSKCGVLYVHDKYKPQIYLQLVSWKPVPLSLVQAGGTIGREARAQQLLPQEDQRHMLVPSGPPRRDLIKTNKTSKISTAILDINT